MKTFLILVFSLFLVNVSIANTDIQNSSLIRLKVNNFDFGNYNFSDSKKLAYLTVSVCINQSKNTHCYRPVMTSPSFGPYATTNEIIERDGVIFNVAAQRLIKQYGMGKINYKLDLYEERLHDLNGGKTDKLLTSSIIHSLHNKSFRLQDSASEINITGNILVQ